MAYKTEEERIQARLETRRKANLRYYQKHKDQLKEKREQLKIGSSITVSEARAPTRVIKCPNCSCEINQS